MLKLPYVVVASVLWNLDVKKPAHGGFLLHRNTCLNLEVETSTEYDVC